MRAYFCAVSSLAMFAAGCDPHVSVDEPEYYSEPPYYRYDSSIPSVSPFDADSGIFPGFDGDFSLPRGAAATPVRLTELRTAATTPPPISGATLALSLDERFAVAADSDRNLLYVIEPDALTTRRVQLPAGSEPGRVVVDAHNVAHVLLRGSGKLVRVDLSTAALLGEISLCSHPRGVAYDKQQDTVTAACMDGQLVTVAATDHSERGRKVLERDLRDVLIGSDGKTHVTRYRSAELLRVGDVGAASMTCPKPIETTRINTSMSLLGPFNGNAKVHFTPTMAWRSTVSADGSLWMLHQQSQQEEVRITAGGYGGDCQNITMGALTRFSADGVELNSYGIALGGVSVDVAISPDQRYAAVASPGSYLAGRGTLQIYSLATASSPGNCSSASITAGVTSQITAVAFGSSGKLYSFSREPAELEVSKIQVSVVDNSALFGDAGLPDFLGDAGFPFRREEPRLERVATIALNLTSVRDTGHELFHADVNSGLACASCHGEALDDGHVWTFEKIGARRTQNMRGGFLSTAPFHWDGDMKDFRHLVDDVLSSRMSGFPVEEQYATALASWIDRQPAVRLASTDTAAVERGRALFESPVVGCATCHSGQALTNNEWANVGTGASFQVPSLRGLALRPPFMHNGCAPTLQERFSKECGGGDQHGKTSQLTSSEVDDLIAYLETL